MEMVFQIISQNVADSVILNVINLSLSMFREEKKRVMIDVSRVECLLHFKPLFDDCLKFTNRWKTWGRGKYPLQNIVKFNGILNSFN